MNRVVSSNLFYAAWNPPFVVLLWISTAVDWWISSNMARSTSTVRCRALLIVSLSANLGLLAVFQYGSFLLSIFVQLMASIGIEYPPAQRKLILIVGISFYTFPTLSYTLDVYRSRMKPWSARLDFHLLSSDLPRLRPILQRRD